MSQTQTTRAEFARKFRELILIKHTHNTHLSYNYNFNIISAFIFEHQHVGRKSKIIGRVHCFSPFQTYAIVGVQRDSSVDDVDDGWWEFTVHRLSGFSRKGRCWFIGARVPTLWPLMLCRVFHMFGIFFIFNFVLCILYFRCLDIWTKIWVQVCFSYTFHLIHTTECAVTSFEIIVAI